MFVHMLLKYSP